MFFRTEDERISVVENRRYVLMVARIVHARLQLDYLNAAKNDRDLKNMLNSLPDGLEYTYETLLSNTSSQYRERLDEIRRLLRCLVIATPTLTAANLAEILAILPGQRILDFDIVATDPYDVLDAIALFLILNNTRKKNSVVKLSHYSADEYLTSKRIQQDQASHFHVRYDEGNAWVASISLQYLTLDVFRYDELGISRSGPPSFENYTFRHYAALHWFQHYVTAEEVPRLKEACRPYLARLFYDNQGSPCYKRCQEVYRLEDPYDETHSYSAICFAISQGLDEVVNDLLAQLIDVDVSFQDGYTCLIMAARWNQISTLRKLLGVGASIEKSGIKGCTPLHVAAVFASREHSKFFSTLAQIYTPAHRLVQLPSTELSMVGTSIL
jgi:hypothetical protein